MDAGCCRNFFSSGPKIKDNKEKERIASQVRNLGLDTIADYIEANREIPVKGDNFPATCSLLNGNYCMLDGFAKPLVCRDYPLFIELKNEKVTVELDVSCKSVNNYLCINGEILKRDFEETFKKTLDFGFFNSVEERMKRFYGDEL